MSLVSNRIIFSVLMAVVAAGCAYSPAVQPEGSSVEYHLPENQTGSSGAVVVRGGALAHTGLVLPADAEGTVHGASTAEQIDHLLDRIGVALEPANGSRDDIVKMNVQVTNNEVLREAQAEFARIFSDEQKPAVAYNIGELPNPAARIGADIVAAVPQSGSALDVLHAQIMGDSPDVGHVAIAPMDQMLYVSGQAVRGDDLIEAMHESVMAGLARIAYLGLSARDIVQLKIFQSDMSRANEVRAELESYFIEKPAPPMVFTQWDRSDGIEVEMIAANPATADENDAVTIRWSPEARQIPQYSRLAEINYGDLVYLSGIHGDPSKDAAGQIEEIYSRMEEVLGAVGSDFGHLLKATYYISDWQAPRLVLNDVRAEVYPEGRPPTSSLILVESVGCEGGCQTAIDMIGVVPSRN